MTAGDLQAPTPARRLFQFLAPVLLVIASAGATIGVIASPAAMRWFFGADDYSDVADVGQAYGGASAVVACLALFVVTSSIVLQFRQLKEVQRDAVAEFAEELVLMAMHDPRYRQCWGSRFAPEGVDEDLFYYCGKVIKNWGRMWDLRVIGEAQMRGYLRAFFDSEIPRMFWEKHGDWYRRDYGRSRREEFRALVNDEYLQALRGGPPSRGREFCEPVAGEPNL